MKIETSVRNGLQELPEGPVYLVSTGFEGKRNIISVAMFAYMSGKTVSIGVAPSRYSFELIRKSGAYVINVVDENLLDAVKICGENSGREVDKFGLARLTPVGATMVDAPIIDESPVSLECKVIKEIEVGGHVWFVADVQAAHVREGYEWKDGLILKWIGQDRFYFKVGEKIGRF